MYFLANAKTYDKQFEIAGTHAYSSNLLVGKKKKEKGVKSTTSSTIINRCNIKAVINQTKFKKGS